MATPVSHMDDLDMVHIRRKKEKGKKRKRNGGGVERERERDPWSINSSKYFLRLLVLIKFS